MTIQIRNYRETDLELLVVLYNAIEAVDHVEDGASITEMREFLTRPDLHPESDYFVAEEDRRLVAYGAVTLKHEAEESGFRTWFNVHPMYRGRGLADRMLARLEVRARGQLGELPDVPIYMTSHATTEYRERIDAIERAGMHEIRRFWVMRHDHIDALPVARFPEGFVVRTYHLGEDDAEGLDSLNDSFSQHFGYTPETLETWQHYLHTAAYRPELTVLAIDPELNRIAGFCHIVINEDECKRLEKARGWIDILGVRREYRNRGLGEALLVQGMQNIYEAGVPQAVLGCDSENTTNATRLYERVGYVVHRESVLYSKYLRTPEPSPESARELAAVS